MSPIYYSAAKGEIDDFHEIELLYKRQALVYKSVVTRERIVNAPV